MYPGRIHKGRLARLIARADTLLNPELIFNWEFACRSALLSKPNAEQILKLKFNTRIYSFIGNLWLYKYRSLVFRLFLIISSFNHSGTHFGYVSYIFQGSCQRIFCNVRPSANFRAYLYPRGSNAEQNPLARTSELLQPTCVPIVRNNDWNKLSILAKKPKIDVPLVNLQAVIGPHSYIGAIISFRLVGKQEGL